MVFEPCQEENGKDISKWGETGELNHKKKAWTITRLIVQAYEHGCQLGPKFN